MKIAAAYGPWTDFGDPPILRLMDSDWQDCLKDDVIDRLDDIDEDFENELMEADISLGGSFASEFFGFSVDIETTDALTLLKGLKPEEKPEQGARGAKP